MVSYLRSYHINLAPGPSEHIVLFAVLTVCPFFFGAAGFLFDYIGLLNIKVEGV